MENKTLKVIKNIEQITNFQIFFTKKEKLFLLKNFWIFSLQMIFFILIVIFAYYGYHNVTYIINDHLNDQNNIDPSKWGNLNLIPGDIRTFRGLMDMSIVIYIVLFGLSIKKAYNYFKKDKTLSILLILSFIPLFALAGFVYNFKYFTKETLIHEWKSFFSNDPALKEDYKWFSFKRNVILVEWIIFLPTIVFIFYSRSETTAFNVEWVKYFVFNTMFYFTIESNFACFVFLTILLFFPYWQVFKTNLIQISVTSYILLVGLIWLLILLPSFVINENIKYWTPYFKASTIWMHIVNPTTFLIFSLILILKCKKCNNVVRNKSLLHVLIFPLAYSLFVAILPFNTGVSMYGWVTNLNHNLAIFANLNKLDSKINYGEWYYIFAFVAVNIICLIIAYCLFYFEHRQKIKHNYLLSICEE